MRNSKFVMTYNEFVKKAQKEIKHRKNYKAGNLELGPCGAWLDGHQINLWTYWQGYQLKDIDKKHVDILLVGLDWGNPDRKGNQKVIEQIRKIENGDESAHYIAGSATDKRLARMFKASFGVDIMEKFPKYRLFFTNYSLGYRLEGQSETGNNSNALLKMDEDLFNKLVSTIQPKIIICLGQLPFEMVSGIKTKDFVKHLKEGNPFKAPFPKDNKIMVYGVSHTGSRGYYNMGSDEEVMLKPWKKIKKEFENIKNSV